VDCYNVFPTWFLFCCSVSPHVFFLNYLSRIYFFNIELVENLALAFPICFVFPFFFLFCFLPKNCLFFVFFSKLFLSIFFYYWADWKFSFLVFFFKTLWIATVFLHMVFLMIFLFFFFGFIFVDFIFFILSWLKI